MSSAIWTRANKGVPRFRGSRGSGGSSGSGGSLGSGGSSGSGENQNRRTAERAEPSEPQASDSFRPWHFFLLASLMTATVAVMLSRQATPAHLVLISLTIIAAGLAAAAFYRMLAPLAAPDMAMFSETLSERARAGLEREKMLLLRSIKELEFDRAMGKLSAKDFEQMSQRLRTRAIALMKQLDEGSSGYREVIERELRARLAQPPGSGGRPSTGPARPELAEGRGPESDLSGPGAGAAETVAATATVVAGTCAACGTTSEHDATFCKRCGAKL